MYYSENKIGEIEVICGPMFAGKTEELIRRTRRMEYAKKKYLIFKANIDNRYSTDEVVSHNKSKIKAISIDINKPEDIEKYVTDDISALVIDEVQFFDKSIIKLLTKYANQGLRIICAGLDLNFKGEPFGIMPELLALAEHVTKLTAICMVCGEEATRTQRIIDGKPAKASSETIMVGAKESYEARCRKCHEVIND